MTADSKKWIKNETDLDLKTSEEACGNQKVREAIMKSVNKTNALSVSKAAHIKKFKLLPTDFSQPGGELTPTMKLKRKVTEQKYQREIE